MPRLSSALLQAPIRSIEIGRAEATPIAVPRSLARFSSLPAPGRFPRPSVPHRLRHRPWRKASPGPPPATRRRCAAPNRRRDSRARAWLPRVRWLHHRVGDREAPPHEIGDPGITLKTAEVRSTPVEILLRRKRREQGLGARVVVGIIERLHRNLQHVSWRCARARSASCRDPSRRA